MTKISAPFLPVERLREFADGVLAEHHATGEIPVPIEEIAEFGFRLDIVPVPGLKDQFDIDAFITNDLSEIRVDQFIYGNRPSRYRFSLAHELAHLIAHKDLFRLLKFSTIDEWKSVMKSIPEDDYGWIEWQAYELAGMILVPAAPLSSIFQDKICEANRAGIDTNKIKKETDLQRIIEANIAKYFEVSADVIGRRAKRESLWD